MGVAALALIVMTATWAVLIGLMRAPMGSPQPIAPLEVFVLAGAVMLAWCEGVSRVLSGRWSYVSAFLLTLAVLFSPALVWILRGATTPVLSLIFLGVWIAGLRGMVRECRDARMWELTAAIGIGVALGFSYFLYVNTKGYGNVFSPEQTLLGTQHRDTLFHASIAGMLGQFGVPSTGLDGLVPVRYYFLSHALIGVTGRWIGVPPIHAYYLVNQLLLIPLLLFSVVAASFWAWQPRDTARVGIVMLLVPLLLVTTFEVWDWSSYLVSESYALSLSLLLLALPLIMELPDATRGPAYRALAACAALGIAALAIVLSKSAVAVLFAGGASFMALRARLRLPCLVVIVAMMAAVLAIGVAVTSVPAYAGTPLIGPLHFFRAYPDAAYPNMWMILLGLVTGAWSWRSVDRAHRIRVECLLAMALAALGCGVLFQIGAGAAYYFMNVGAWVAMVLASGTVILPRVHHIRRPGTAAIALGLSIAVAIAAQPDKRRAGSNLRALAATVDAQSADQVGRPAPTMESTSALFSLLSPRDPVRADIARTVARTPGGRMRSQLLPDGRTSGDVIYVPPDNSEFWNLNKTFCSAPPFFVPALTARPMLHGLPPSRESCPLPPETGYGYGDYTDSSRSAAISDEQLCEDVRKLGFRTARVLYSADASRVLTCR